MSGMRAAEFREIRAWMFRNARPIDLMRWKHRYEGGGGAAIVALLRSYQNEDGGFGHGLEADNWNPNSSPYTTGTAIELLFESGESLAGPTVDGILRYLEVFAPSSGGRWPFTVPTNDLHPHAPWWSYSERTNDEYGYDPTSVLAGFILAVAPRDGALYRRALGIADAMAEKLDAARTMDCHELQCYVSSGRRSGAWA